MGRGRRFEQKPHSRPKKKPAERRRREKQHRKRLVALGVDEKSVQKMNPQRVRRLLRRPKKIARAKA